MKRTLLIILFLCLALFGIQDIVNTEVQDTRIAMEVKNVFLPELPEEFKENLGRNVVVTTIDKIAGWARSSSL